MSEAGLERDESENYETEQAEVGEEQDYQLDSEDEFYEEEN